jgi:hypothetical protein
MKLIFKKVVLCYRFFHRLTHAYTHRETHASITVISFPFGAKLTTHNIDRH